MMSWQNLALPSPFHLVQSAGTLLASFDYIFLHVPMLFLSCPMLSSFAEAWAATAAQEHCHDPSEHQQHQARNGECGLFLDEENNRRVLSVPRASTAVLKQWRLRVSSQCVLRVLPVLVS